MNRKLEPDGLKVKVKAIVCLQGFKEVISPRSDSATVVCSKNRLFWMICANKNWKIRSMDVTSAFLQVRN